MLQRVSVVFAIAAAIAVTGCSKREKVAAEKTTDTVSVSVMQVQPQSFTEYGTYFGRIEAIDEAQIICYSGGRVGALKAREGVLVKAGMSLASIDSAKASSLLETARLQEKIALQNLDQTRKHLLDGNMSQLAVDQANLAYLGAQNARIDAEKNHSGALAISPINGLVTTRFINLHQELPPGTPTFTVAQTGTMKVIVGVAESDAGSVKVGSAARVTVEMIRGRTWEGTIKFMAREASRENKTFNAEIHVPNRDGALKPGLTARAQLIVNTHKNAIVVPTAAVHIEGVRYSVMVVDAENRARRRSVFTGAQSDTTTLIAGGLAAGEQVIVAGQHMASPGTPVKIVNQ